MSTEDNARYLFAAANSLDDAAAIIDIGCGTWAYGDRQLTAWVTGALGEGKMPVVVTAGHVDDDDDDDDTPDTVGYEETLRSWWLGESNASR